MKNIFKKIIFSLILMGLLVPVVSLGENEIKTGFDAGFGIAEDASRDAGLTADKTFTAIISGIIGWLMTLLAVTAVLMFVVAGAMYVATAGNEEIIKKAKKIMTYAATGLVISLCGFLIVEAIAAIVGDCSLSFFGICFDSLFD